VTARHSPGASIPKAPPPARAHSLATHPPQARPWPHHAPRASFRTHHNALTLRQTYFVDNVTTSGHTLEAARAALGFGAGLVFADAAPRRVQLQATLF